MKKTFDNATEAELSLRQIQSKLKYHLISEIEIIENQVKSLNKTYQVTGKIQLNSPVIESYKNRAGRFIIATNRLDSEVAQANLSFLGNEFHSWWKSSFSLRLDQ